MAVRITHTNNSSGHDGTYVYRSTSPMDPQALPAPIADAPPAALGATFEHIDSPADGTHYYRTQDHEGGQVSTVSDEVSIAIGPDYAAAQIGDEIGGGIYAGTITYADARQFHIIASKAGGEDSNALVWGNSGTLTGASDSDDGWENQQLILSSFDDGSAAAFYHCRDFAGGGYADWYLPAINELTLVSTNLAGHSEFSANTSSGHNTWSSTEYDANQALRKRFSSNETQYGFKNQSNFTKFTRPIRRVSA